MKTKTTKRHSPKNNSHTRKAAQKSRSPVVHALKFLPAVVFFIISLSLPGSALSKITHSSRHAVLSYATSMSGSDLLAQTNAQRSGNGVANLSYNSQLSNAAQTKANDMVTRNYWSHTSPTGEEPWVFISNAGYQYQAAGENLAYGFITSSDTITGWMNSPPHRENLLSTSFTEVGFGFANSANYVDSGEQTVVVAMYGAPLSQPAPAPPAPVQSTPAPTQPAQPVTNTPSNAEVIQTTVVQTVPAKVTDSNQKISQSLGAEKTAAAEAPTAKEAHVNRIQLLTGGSARWSSTLLVFSIIGVGFFWLLERGRQIKHLVLAGEHFMLKHLHIDLAVIGFIFLGFSLLQTSGLVR